MTFVVEETLAGRGGMLKESIIGVEVFGRAPGYDPKIDPIVRVQARRLRSTLDTWYETGGQSSTIRIWRTKVVLPIAARIVLAAAAIILTLSRNRPAPPG